MPIDEFLGLSPAGWAAVAAIATVGTFLVALTAVLYARRQLKLALDQFQEQRNAQVEAERPYVIVTIEPSRATMRVQDLVIRNIGHRPAFDTRISVDPPPVTTLDQPGLRLSEARILTQPIPLIAPTQELRAIFDNTTDRLQRNDLPEQFTVTVQYRDSAGHPYNEVSTVEWKTLEGATFIDSLGVHHAAKALKEIEKTLKRRASE